MTILQPFLTYPEKIKKDDFSDINWAKRPSSNHFREKSEFNAPIKIEFSMK